MKHIKLNIISIEEMNRALETFDDCIKVYRTISRYDTDVVAKAFIDYGTVNFELTGVRGGKMQKWHCKLDGSEDLTTINGGDAWRVLSGEYKRRTGARIPEMPLENCTRPLLLRRISSDRTRQYAYGYDMNKAYAYGLMQTMPDFSKPAREKCRLKEGEIGYYEAEVGKIKDCFISQENVIQLHATDKPGDYVDIAWPAMPSPFVDYVERWTKRGDKAKRDGDRREQQKCKDMINFAVGMLRRKNTYLNARVLSFIRDYMLSFVDEDTLLCNTDSLISRRPRKDLPLGNAVGQFKTEHIGMFAYVGYNYQWTDADGHRETHKRGPVSKTLYTDDYDILTDPDPEAENVMYIYNPNTNRIERNKNYGKKNK